MDVEQLSVNEWPRLRDVRLAALTESPRAFQARLADERIYSAEKWTSFLAAADWFVFARNWASSAVVAAMPGPGDREFEVLSLWVAPGDRRRGIGSALIQRVIAHGRNEGATALVMAVAMDNPSLLRLARRNRFVISEVTAGRNQPPLEAAQSARLCVAASRLGTSTTESTWPTVMTRRLLFPRSHGDRQPSRPTATFLPDQLRPR